VIHTEGLEEQLNRILNDPDSMAQILSMAQSFGMGQESEPSQAAPPPVGEAFSIDPGMLIGMMDLFRQMQNSDPKQDALLCALRPYLAPERQEKLDRAIQLARLSYLAKFALGNSGLLFGGKGG
jgi:hypothetical protein